MPPVGQTSTPTQFAFPASHAQDRLRSRSGKARRKQVRRSTAQSLPVFAPSALSSVSSESPKASAAQDDWLVLKTHQVQLVRVKELRASPPAPPPFSRDPCALHQSLAFCSSTPSICSFERLPNEVLERIFEFVPDKHSFPPTFRSRHSIYGFSPPIEHDPLASLPPHRWNESEGWVWYTPPMHYRLVNKRWAVVAAQVFLRHLSVTTLTRLDSLGALLTFSSYLASSIRTLALTLTSANQPSPPFHLRTSLRRLLTPLTSLRSLSLRSLSPGLLFPAPLTVDALFLPPSIQRFAIEFSATSSSLVAALSTSATTSSLVTLHAAELNLFLVSLPHLRSLHIARFASKPARPLARYFAHPASLPKNRLSKLSLEECRLSEVDWRFLGLRFGTGLEELKIEETAFGPAPPVALVNIGSMLEGCGPRLEALDIRVRNWEPRGSAMVLDTLVGRLRALKYLSVSGGLISLSGLDKLPSGLERLTLEHLGSMGIDAQALAKWRGGDGLVELELGGRIGPWSAEDVWALQRTCWGAGRRWREAGGAW